MLQSNYTHKSVIINPPDKLYTNNLESTDGVTGTITSTSDIAAPALAVTDLSSVNVVCTNLKSTILGVNNAILDGDGDFDIFRDCSVGRNVDVTGNVSCVDVSASGDVGGDIVTGTTSVVSTGNVISGTDISAGSYVEAVTYVEAGTDVNALAGNVNGLNIRSGSYQAADGSVGLTVASGTGNVDVPSGDFSVSGGDASLLTLRTSTINASDDSPAFTITNATGDVEHHGSVFTTSELNCTDGRVSSQILNATGTPFVDLSSITEVQLHSESSLHPLRIGNKVKQLEVTVADLSTVLTGAVSSYGLAITLPQYAVPFCKCMRVLFENVTLVGAPTATHMDASLGSAAGVIDLLNRANSGAATAWTGYATAAVHCLGDLYGTNFHIDTSAGSVTIYLTIYGLTSLNVAQNFATDITGGSLSVTIPYILTSESADV